MASAELLRPASAEEAATQLRELAAAGGRARIRGADTARALAPGHEGPHVDLDTRRMDAITDHNEGDFTAVVQPGVQLADLQSHLAEHGGQMLALDPPEPDATIGGIVAAARSGPWRHRYGSPRDLVLGVTVVLSDGTIARAGGKVIKNVAGYDLAKLFTGSLGTLGVITELALRLHPAPEDAATVVAESPDPGRLAAAAAHLAGLPLEADCLDAAWAGGSGRLLVRFTGRSARARAEATAGELDGLQPDVVGDDAALWAEQRDRQHGTKLTGTITDLPDVLRAAADVGGSVVVRVALGVSWLAPPHGEALPDDVLPHLRPALSPGARTLMGRLKARFDPDGVFPTLKELR